MLIKLQKNNLHFFFIAIACFLAIIYALIAEYGFNVNPCPLCIVERVIILTIAVLSLLFAIHNAKAKIIAQGYNIVLLLLTLFGLKVSIHHEWLVNLPIDQQPQSCGMPLDALYAQVPLHQFLHYLLQGNAECAQITWKILGLNAPLAVIIFLAIIAIIILYSIFKNIK